MTEKEKQIIYDPLDVISEIEPEAPMGNLKGRIETIGDDVHTVNL